MEKEDKKIISFELPLTLYNRLLQEAKNDGRSVSSFLRKLIEQSINEQQKQQKKF